jgi:hypothetical protein
MQSDCHQVVTEDDMLEIQADIQSMITPSWMTSVPANLGSPSHGKLKADQWRVLRTTYLPISFIRLWATVNHGDKRSERCAQILDVTLSLLSAVTIASSWVTSPARALLYLQHMQAYLDGIRVVFPDYKFLPNHHMALHLHEYLVFYGPVHAWWTFPFERLIGMLQRIPTNNRFGKSTICPMIIAHLRDQANWKKPWQNPSLAVPTFVAFCQRLIALRPSRTANRCFVSL